MINSLKRLLAAVTCLLVFSDLFSRDINSLFPSQPKDTIYPYGDEIAAFKKQDSLRMPPKGKILFVGSSSFRKWERVHEDLPGHYIINRGFGGAVLTDIIHYADQVIFPYLPKQVVIYCGDNDIANSDKVTARIVLERFQTLFEMIRARWPRVSIVFVSIKPAPSRWHLRNIAMEANQLVKQFLQTKKRTAFVDIWPAMLDASGKPDPSIFLDDSLHMNSKGYDIWTRAIKPYLKK